MPCDHSIWGIWVPCPQILLSLRKNGQEESRLLNLRRLRSSRFFTQISGRNFFPELSGEDHPGTAPLQALCCALCSTEQSTVRGGEKGEKVPRKGEEEGWPAKGAKRKKGCVKTGQTLSSTHKSTRFPRASSGALPRALPKIPHIQKT